MTAKISWDNATYWSVTALLFFQRRLTDLGFMASIEPLLRRFFVLHARMQQFFNAWERVADVSRAPGHTNVMDVERLPRLQNSLDGSPQDDAALKLRLERNVAWLEAQAYAWQQIAADQHPALGRFVAPAQPPKGEPVYLEPLRIPVPARA